MSREIQIADCLSSTDISSWPSSGGPLTFIVRRASEFAFLADLDAVIKVHQLEAAGSDIHLKFSFDWSSNFIDDFLRGEYGAFDGLFGLSLLLSAQTISFRNQRVPSSLADRIWEKVISHGAMIRSYRKGHVVFRDPDYPIPDCLRTATSTFPFPTDFKRILREVARGVPQFGGQGIGSETEEDRLLSFLYETARNAHEHARPRTPNRRLPQIRGITVENRGVDELDGTGWAAEAVRQYAERARLIFRRIDAFVVMSVVDLGPGVHNTLPALASESQVDTLVRAITTDASSKPRSSDATRGRGLPNVLTASQRLRAFLLVRSGNLAAHYDGSTPPENLTLVTGPSASATGTAVTLVWPLAPFSTSQTELFSR